MEDTDVDRPLSSSPPLHRDGGWSRPHARETRPRLLHLRLPSTLRVHSLRVSDLSETLHDRFGSDFVRILKRLPHSPSVPCRRPVVCGIHTQPAVAPSLRNANDLAITGSRETNSDVRHLRKTDICKRCDGIAWACEGDGGHD